ncbi:acyl carrier protein [Streptomyces sp. NPDC059248]|uniref:acyl carrier protein n=1 Tax=Streptomyces sp. NPDC059248 TaxID=3346791 RepID=UPI0036834EE6
MSTAGAEEQIIAFMVDRLGLQPEEITRTARFKEDLELDSLDMVEMVTIMEEQLGITMDDSMATSLTTLGAVVDFLESRQQLADGNAA